MRAAALSCRKENQQTNKYKKLSAICTGVATLALLVVVFSAPYTEQKLAPAPTVRPVCVFTKEDRVIPPPKSKPALVSEKSAKVKSISTPPAQIDFEPPKHGDSPAISMPEEAPRGNPAPEPTASQNTAADTAQEPKMGDTRIVDGQPQIYFRGFGWIEDHGGGGEGIAVDGDGDINKMVGTMN